MKKMLSLILVFVLVMSLAPSAFAAEEKKEPNIHWTDVEVPSGWRLRDASYVKEFGILSCWLMDAEHNNVFVNIDMATGKRTDRFGDLFIHPFSCGLTMFAWVEEDNSVWYAYATPAGETVTTVAYSVARPFFDGYAAVVEEYSSREYMYIDVNGKEVFTSDNINRFYNSDFQNGVAVVGGAAVIDKNLKYVVEPGVYKSIDKFYDGMAVVTDQNSKKGLINEKGEVVLPCAYDQLYYDGAAELICVGNYDGNKNLKFGYVDLTGKVVIPLRYDDAVPFSDGLAHVEIYENGDWHHSISEFIDSTGKTVIPIEKGTDYNTWSTMFRDGLLDVAKYDENDDPWFTMIDTSGKEVMPWVKGDTARAYSNGVITAGDLYNDTWKALYDTEGNKIISSDDCSYVVALTEENPDGIREPEIIAVADGKIGWFRYPEDFGEKKEEEVTPTGFTDVPAGAYYTDAVKWAVEEEITTGVTSTTFAPNKACTRAEIVTFLWRAKGKPEPTTTENPFTDVSANSFAYKAILWAAEEGITTGTGKNTFNPNGTCTRGEAMTFQWRAANMPAASGASGFTDVRAGAFYADAVNWAVEEEITNGVTSTTFAPNKNCTRGDIVTFLWRDLGK